MDPHLHPPAHALLCSPRGYQGVRQGGLPTHGEAQAWARQQGQAPASGGESLRSLLGGVVLFGCVIKLSVARILHHDAWSWT